MVKYYHGTVKEFLPSIRKVGLKSFGQQGIFVTTDKQQAWFWAQMGAMEYNQSYRPGHRTLPVVLEIDPEALEGHRLVVDTFGADEGFDYYVLGLHHIPPRYLKIREELPDEYRIPGVKKYFARRASHEVRVRGHRRRA